MCRHPDHSTVAPEELADPSHSHYYHELAHARAPVLVQQAPYIQLVPARTVLVLVPVLVPVPARALVVAHAERSELPPSSVGGIHLWHP